MADKIAARTFAVTLFCAVLAGSSSLVYTGKWIGKVDTKLENIEKDISVMQEDVSGLKEDVSGLKKDVSGLKKNASRLEGLIKDIPSKLEMRTLLYSAIALGKSSPEAIAAIEAALGQSSPEATESASATVTPKRKVTEPSEDTKVPPRTRTP